MPSAPSALAIFKQLPSIVSLHWATPLDTANFTVTDYKVQIYNTNGSTSETFFTGGRTRFWVTSLQSYSDYVVTVQAINEAGLSSASYATFTTQIGAKRAVAAVVAAVPTKARPSVRFTLA